MGFFKGRYSCGAIKLNTQVISIHLNSKITILTPVCTPWITCNPKFLSIFNTITYNWNFMIKWNRFYFLWIDATTILIEWWSSLNSTANWAICWDFCFHLCYSNYMIIFRNIIMCIRNFVAVIKTVLIWSWGRSKTISAKIKVLPRSIVKIWRCILFTSTIRYSICVSKFIYLGWITSVTITTSLNIYDSLSV